MTPQMTPKLKVFTKNKNENKDTTTSNDISNRRMSTSTHSTTASSTTTSPSHSTTFPSHSTTSPSHSTTSPQTDTHNPAPTTLVESFLESTSIKLTDGTKYALSTISLSGIIDTYLSPLIPYFHNLYLSQPPGGVERIGMWGCLVAGTLPVMCVVLGVGMACLGCFIVTGSALLIIQISCLAFIGCVLAPAGVLTALFVGLPSLICYGIYTSCSLLKRRTSTRTHMTQQNHAQINNQANPQ